VADHASIPVLFSTPEIAAKVKEMAEAIRKAMGTEFMVIALLKGGFVFSADLVRALHHAGCSPQIDFLTLSSYGEGTESTGTVALAKDITDSVQGKKVLLVDDILESGRTLAYAKELLLKHDASSVSIAVLLEKPGKRKVNFHADFVGFTVPDKFVVGYGLDFANHYRELPFIGYLEKH